MNKTAVKSSPLQTKNLRALISEAAQEILSDPDFGLELGETAKRRLNRVLSISPRKTTSLLEIKKKYG